MGIRLFQSSLLVICVALLACFWIDTARGESIVQVLQSEPNYAVLYDLVNRFPDLLGLLSNLTINTTVFAPTNAAFNSITPPSGDSLRDTLYYHLVAGYVQSLVLTDGELVPSLLISPGLGNNPQKTKIFINATAIYINNAQVVQPNLLASNGVVHGIDAVLIPPGTLVDVVGANADLSTLLSAVEAAELANALSSPTLTLFAPTNEAFAAVAQADPILVGYLFANDTQARGDLQKVLEYHVTGSVIYAGDIPAGTTKVPSLEGADLTVTNTNGIVTVDGASVIATNVLASNGVAHVIDQVLLPQTFNLNLRQTLLGLGCTTLVEAVEEAGLTSVLTGPVNFTVFAPSNAAFALLPSLPTGQTLVDVLKYHLTSGNVLTTLLTDGTLLPSLLSLPTLQQAQQLKIFRDQDTVSVNNANITNGNNLAANGIVHVIDRVLLPPADLFTVANSTAALATLASALQAGGLADALTTLGNLTVFAPINSAFAALPSAVLNYLLTAEGKTDLQSVLEYHVVPSAVIYSSEVPTSPVELPTLNAGQTVKVVKNGQTVEVNQAKVVVPDVLASNGVAHAIDGVLVPSDFVFNLEKALIGLGATDLLAAIKAAGLESVLTGNDSFTIFAPTNAAFARITPPSGQALVDLLKYHVVSGAVLSSDLTNGELVPSLLSLPSLANNAQKLKVTITGTSVFINGVNVTIANTVASNGVVHVIEDVLTEPPTVPFVAANNGFNTLLAAVTQAGLAEALNNTANITLFAPTDAAFNGLSKALLNYLLLPAAKEDLTHVLTYHVLGADALYAADIPAGTTTYATLYNGTTLSVTNGGGDVTINGGDAKVVAPNLLASNGVVHAIDNVLLPPGFEFDLQRALIGLNATLLLAAIEEAGLDGILTGSTNYTIFAPTNEAIAALGNVSLPELTRVLSYHVVTGYIPSADLSNGELLSTLLVEPTLQGRPQRVKISIEGKSVLVNGVNVTIADNYASNGVVHVINSVLLPPKDIPTVASGTPILSTLVALASDAGLLTTLAGANLTVFAPTNTAFQALGEALLNYLQLPSSKSDLQSVLAYHVLGSVVFSTDVPTTPTAVPTLNGADVTVDRNANTGVVTVNDIAVEIPNVLASNGVVHVLPAVLIPPGFDFNLRKALTALGATTLIQLVDKVGLGAVLDSQSANHTIFAPTNQALEKLPSNLTDAEIAEILKYHVILGKETKNVLADGELLPTLVTLASLGGNPQYLKVSLSDSQFLVNGVNVTSADNLASNGVAHVIDSVLLLPPALPDVAMATPTLSKLVDLVVAAGLADALKTDNLTLFAPTNDAFASVGPAIYNYLMMPDAKDDLIGVLEYHVIGGYDKIFYSPDIPIGATVLKTLNGENVTVHRAGPDGPITVNSATVVVADVLAANGVAHAIDAVLIPNDFVFNLRRALIGINATVLLHAIDAAGLSDVLNGTSSYTIFAPTNAALSSLPSNLTVAELAEILKYHVVAGSVPANQMSNGQLLTSLLTVPTLQNQQQKLKVTITPGQIKINDAIVTIPDNMASNGIVHVIDRVLYAPPIINTVANQTSILSTLVGVIQIVGEESVFSKSNLTALAPSNSAFKDLGYAAFSYLQQNIDILENVLNYHVIENTILYTPDLPNGVTKVRSANGYDVTFSKTDKVTVNGVATVTVPNVLASNGVVHIISAVLLPPNFHFSLFNALEGLGDEALLTAFRLAGLEPILNGSTNYTLFAPSKEAMAARFPSGVAALAQKDLVNLLQTHIVAGRFPLEPGMELPTLNNQTLIVGANVSTISLQGAHVTADVDTINPAANGVAVEISKVLEFTHHSDDDDDGLSTTWIIVISVVCAVAVIAILAVGGYFAYAYWQKRQNTYVAIGGDYNDN